MSSIQIILSSLVLKTIQRSMRNIRVVERLIIAGLITPKLNIVSRGRRSQVSENNNKNSHEKVLEHLLSYKSPFKCWLSL